MQQRPVLGATWLVLGMGAFSVSDGLAKLLADDFSAGALTWFRYLGLLLTVLPLAVRQPSIVRTGQPMAQVLRAAGLIGAAVFFLLGLATIPQAEATAMVFASPLFVLILSRWLMRETVGPRGFAPVLLGFAGVLIVVRPGSFHFGGAEIFPLLSSMAWAGAVVLTRKLSATDSVSTTMLYSAALGAVGLAVTVPGIDWARLFSTWPLMLGMTAAWCAAQWLVVAAYRVASPPVIAPFAYSQLLWAALFGLAFAGHWPDAISLLGMVLIVLSGLYAAWLSRART
ncbi:DMT family transporter [Variovorax sp. J22R133]|uniref:DMT family transporter n=1 Tax=Variovorax brevis TaxID=3053503 RepID=UPI002578B2CC|nr:DMT family transporter [Variovorax sp. J22R133]MDM0111794.1 DMT family transporter [Variovorax sp. J22R133]